MTTRDCLSELYCPEEVTTFGTKHIGIFGLHVSYRTHVSICYNHTKPSFIELTLVSNVNTIAAVIIELRDLNLLTALHSLSCQNEKATTMIVIIKSVMLQNPREWKDS